MEQFFKDEESKLRVKKFNIGINKDGEEIREETQEWRDYKNEKRAELLLSKSNLPPHVVNLSLDDYIGEDRDKLKKLKIYVEKFEEKFNRIHLYFWSKENNTQKTTTASTVGKLLLEKGFSVQFVLMSNLIKLLSQESFRDDFVDELNTYRDCDFLIIDDSFDSRKATIFKSGYQIPFLDEFLRTRMEVNRRAICFTSNLSIEEIDDKLFGVSLKNLIKRNIPDPFFFASSYELRNDFQIEDLWS